MHCWMTRQLDNKTKRVSISTLWINVEMLPHTCMYNTALNKCLVLYIQMTQWPNNVSTKTDKKLSWHCTRHATFLRLEEGLNASGGSFLAQKSRGMAPMRACNCVSTEVHGADPAIFQRGPRGHLETLSWSKTFTLLYECSCQWWHVRLTYGFVSTFSVEQFICRHKSGRGGWIKTGRRLCHRASA